MLDKLFNLLLPAVISSCFTLFILVFLTQKKPKRTTKRDKDDDKKPRKIEFSKLIALGVLLVDGYATHRVLALCELAILHSYTGAMAYLTALIGALQAATAYVLGHYFKKSTAENTKGGITYDTALQDANTVNSDAI